VGPEKGTKSIPDSRAVDSKQRWLPQNGVIEALDFGYTEAFVSSRGKAYGKGLGKILTDFSHKLNTTGKARNKLHALEKKYRAEGKTHKARRIRKFNLGLDKKDSVKHRAQASLENKVNSGFNELLEGERPAALVVEDLRHVFTFDNQRDMNRRLSLWAKGIIQDRAELKAPVGGSGLKQVNCAYDSQRCPECGFLWPRNRAGDAFKCLFCGHEGHSDAIAATNYLQRSTDTEIALHTPYRAVKVILMGRFLRRLECAGVLPLPSGLAPETVASIMKEWESFVLRSAKTAPERTSRSQGHLIVVDLFDYMLRNWVYCLALFVIPISVPTSLNNFSSCLTMFMHVGPPAHAFANSSNVLYFAFICCLSMTTFPLRIVLPSWQASQCLSHKLIC
jgi:hypothetical protein